MAALVGYFQTVVLRKLFARFDFERDSMPVRVELAARAFVQRESGIDEIAAVASQPIRVTAAASR